MIIEDIFCEMPTLETERLVLRKLSLVDAEDIFEYTSDPEFAKHLAWGPTTSIEDTIGFLSDTMFRYQLGDVAGWGLVLKETGRLVGTCGFTQWDPENHKAEIGYALARNHWGKGLMTEAVRQAIEYGFRGMELNRIEGMCEIRNAGSARVMEKAGMRREGLMRQHSFFKGEFHDMILYGLLKSDFDAHR